MGLTVGQVVLILDYLHDVVAGGVPRKASAAVDLVAENMMDGVEWSVRGVEVSRDRGQECEVDVCDSGCSRWRQ